MPDVNAIIETLRAIATKPQFPSEVPLLPLADAEAAVLAAVDARTAEIVGLLCDHGESLAGVPMTTRKRLADSIARRFPNEGTNAPPVSGGDEGNTP